jgi:hypothetical protein
VKLGAAKMVAPSLLAGGGSARIGRLRMNGDRRSTSDHRQRDERAGEKLGHSCFSLLAVGATASVSRLRMYRHRKPDSDQRQHYDQRSSYLAHHDPFSWRPPKSYSIHAPGRCDLHHRRVVSFLRRIALACA